MAIGPAGVPPRSTLRKLAWAHDHHDVVIEDRHGKIVDDFRFEETADGWKLLKERLSRYPDVAVAIETSSGAVVERLLEARYAVYPVNPKAAKRYRERKVPSGTKTDHIDAWTLADALRLDGYGWRPLKRDHPLTLELRLLCRDEITLIEQRTALICQLRAALHEYYPTALQAFDDWISPGAWAFVERFPTPEALVAAGKRKWEKFLHVFKLYHSEKLYAKRLELFAAADQCAASQAISNAKSLLAVTLAIQLRVLQKQLDQYRAMIAKLFAQPFAHRRIPAEWFDYGSSLEEHLHQAVESPVDRCFEWRFVPAPLCGNRRSIYWPTCGDPFLYIKQLSS